MARFCIFCGKAPEDKNREHVLPQWLIALTGDPNRVVNFGFDYENEKVLRFSWANFVAPSCRKCNEEYSGLEGIVKPLVQALIERRALRAFDYLVLLDWLDKVRVGLWLTYHLIQKDPTRIEPSFHINSRVGTKDRMLAIYLMGTKNIGLNAVGTETFVFNRTPSCFVLNINNVAILNMSFDFLFARRCGFPAPARRVLQLDAEEGARMAVSDFTTSRRIMHPLIRTRIYKPSVHLYQPIMIPAPREQYRGGYLGAENDFDSYLAEMTLPEKPHQGVLFNQTSESVTPVSEADSEIEYQEVADNEAKHLYEIFAQTYDLQSYCHLLSDLESSDSERVRLERKLRKAVVDRNEYLKREYLKLWTSEQSPKA
jgi:hypothetical protein